ncbi:MAG: Mpo1-like protein [Gemmataceae bacterium]
MTAPVPPTDAPGRPLRRFLRRRLEGWRLRHQLPFNFWIHMLGIPLAYPVTLVFLGLGMWIWAAGAFVLGFVLQWVGHLAEGNDVGEWAAVKRLFGLPYVGISPRWNPDDPTRL